MPRARPRGFQREAEQLLTSIARPIVLAPAHAALERRAG